MKIIKQYHEIKTEIDTEKIMSHLEWCGRTCYQSNGLIKENSADKFIKTIINSGHLSVIEHQNLTVKFITNRGVSHELVRHRLASYSQESTRYCAYNKDKFGSQLTFIQPSWFTQDVVGEHDIKWIGVYGRDIKEASILNKKENRWFWNCAICERDYLRLIYEGAKPEEARDILNNSIKTEIVVSCNVRQWREIFNQRCSRDAHPDIRNLMIPLLKELKEKLPILFEDIKYYEDSK